jgi:hypothetical protein
MANCSIGLALAKGKVWKGTEKINITTSLEPGAMGGDVVSRYNLRNMEFRAGNNM